MLVYVLMNYAQAATLGKGIVFGPVSSLFDILTYILLFFVFCPAVCGMQFAAITDGGLQAQFISVFQTGWFVESMLTQIIVVYMLRSPGLPFGRNAVSLPVFLTTACGVAFLTAVPYTFGYMIGLSPLPAVFFVIPVSIVITYALLITLLKKIYLRRYGDLI